jgi:hypothetical protein
MMANKVYEKIVNGIEELLYVMEGFVWKHTIDSREVVDSPDNPDVMLRLSEEKVIEAGFNLKDASS